MPDELAPSQARTGRPHVRAVPWTTPTEEKVKGALGEVPAYMRRARKLEDEIGLLWEAAGTAREELLPWVCLRLRRLLDLPEERLREEFSPASDAALESLYEEVRRLEPFRRLRPRPGPGARRGLPSRALEALRGSIIRFNRAWTRWIDEESGLETVNELIEGYNRHFVFERQCAVRYVPLNRLTFRKKKPLSRLDLLERHPLLTLP